MRLWHVPNARGFRRRIFLKKRRVGCIIFHMSALIFFKVQVFTEPFTCPPWEIFVRKSSAVLFENQLVPTLWLATFVFAKWWAFEAASCPRHKTLNEDNTYSLHVTPPLRKHFVGGWQCALNVYRGYNLVIRSLNGRQCCNKDERLSFGSCR